MANAKSVKYLGTYPEGQVDDDGVPYIDQYEYRFQPNKAVSISDEYHLEKLSGNRFFEVSGESKKDEVDAARLEAEESEAETLRAYLADEKVPVRANASLDNLRKAKADHEAAKLKAQEG